MLPLKGGKGVIGDVLAEKRTEQAAHGEKGANDGVKGAEGGALGRDHGIKGGAIGGSISQRGKAKSGMKTNEQRLEAIAHVEAQGQEIDQSLACGPTQSTHRGNFFFV